MLIKTKRKSIEYIKKEGYYIVDDHNNEIILTNQKEIQQKYPLIYCKYNGECNIQEQNIGYYRNILPNEYNIVQYTDPKIIEKPTIINNICGLMNENQNHLMDHNILNNSESCLISKSLYLSVNENHYIKVEETVISYHFINNILYKLNNDEIIQLCDGFYFVNKNNRMIGEFEDYSNINTSSYTCSHEGICNPINRGNKIKYYPDYTSMINGTYNLIKYNPSNLKSSRDNIGIHSEKNGHNGFEIINEEGVFKINENVYSECTLNDYDEIICHDLNRVGMIITNDDEIISCNKNEDENTTECEPATKGGYYAVNNNMYECDPNIEGTYLKCSLMGKEGYYIAFPDDILYECNESDGSTTSEINKILNFPYHTEEMKITVFNSSVSAIEDEAELVDIDKSIDVKCEPIECILNDVIYYKTNEEMIELYKCKRIMNLDTNKWVSTICNSGNYIKDKNGFYQCENEKESITQNFIEPPLTINEPSNISSQTLETEMSKTPTTETSSIKGTSSETRITETSSIKGTSSETGITETSRITSSKTQRTTTITTIKSDTVIATQTTSNIITTDDFSTETATIPSTEYNSPTESKLPQKKIPLEMIIKAIIVTTTVISGFTVVRLGVEVFERVIRRSLRTGNNSYHSINAESIEILDNVDNSKIIDIMNEASTVNNIINGIDNNTDTKINENNDDNNNGDIIDDENKDKRRKRSRKYSKAIYESVNINYIDKMDEIEEEEDKRRRRHSRRNSIDNNINEIEKDIEEEDKRKRKHSRKYSKIMNESINVNNTNKIKEEDIEEEDEDKRRRRHSRKDSHVVNESNFANAVNETIEEENEDIRRRRSRRYSHAINESDNANTTDNNTDENEDKRRRRRSKKYSKINSESVNINNNEKIEEDIEEENDDKKRRRHSRRYSHAINESDNGNNIDRIEGNKDDEAESKRKHSQNRRYTKIMNEGVNVNNTNKTEEIIEEENEDKRRRRRSRKNSHIINDSNNNNSTGDNRNEENGEKIRHRHSRRYSKIMNEGVNVNNINKTEEIIEEENEDK